MQKPRVHPLETERGVASSRCQRDGLATLRLGAARTGQLGVIVQRREYHYLFGAKGNRIQKVDPRYRGEGWLCSHLRGSLLMLSE